MQILSRDKGFYVASHLRFTYLLIMRETQFKANKISKHIVVHRTLKICSLQSVTTKHVSDVKLCSTLRLILKIMYLEIDEKLVAGHQEFRR